MKVLRHAVASLILFSVLITLISTIYSGLEDNYGVVQGDVQTVTNVTTGNIAEQFLSLNLIEGVSDITAGIQALNPGGGSNLLNILDGVATVGVGALKTVVGLVTAPFEIGRIIGTFYAGEIPGVLMGTLLQIIVVYVGFILLSAYLKKDV